MGYTGRLRRIGIHHKKRSNDPIQNNAETNLNPNRSLVEDVVQRLVLDLA